MSDTAIEWTDKADEAKAVLMRDFPITLPSLSIAVIRVPYPMSERDFDFFYDAIGNLKEALVRKEEAP